MQIGNNCIWLLTLSPCISFFLLLYSCSSRPHPPVLLLQKGRVRVGGGGAGLCRHVPPPAGPLQPQHCGGDGRRLLHPQWARPVLHASAGPQTDPLADLLPVLHALRAAFLPAAAAAAAAAAAPPARWVEERRRAHQLPQRPAAGPGPAGAGEHYKLP